MTVKLFEQDAYTRSFEATVQSCEHIGDAWFVTLDQTAFFPEGGGQAADTGTLGGAAVTDVQIQNGIITHTTDAPLPVGTAVTGEIDWDQRFSRMQNHTGEHLVSGLIHAAHGYDNVGFHMNDSVVTLDVNGALSEDDVRAIERQANRAVYENRAVFATYPSSDEIAAFDYRSKLDLTEGVRLITIEGYDCCACCAPHVAKTGEIGLIKILDAVPYKGGTRLDMICGMLAFEDYAALHESNRRIMRLLSASREKTADFVAKDHETIAALRTENKRLSEQLTAAQLETVTVGETLCGFTGAASFDDLRSCVNNLIGQAAMCVLFAKADDGSFSYVAVSEHGDVRDTVKALNAAFGGKGGGKANYAQGKLAAADKDALIAFFGG